MTQSLRAHTFDNSTKLTLTKTVVHVSTCSKVIYLCIVDTEFPGRVDEQKDVGCLGVDEVAPKPLP